MAVMLVSINVGCDSGSSSDSGVGVTPTATTTSAGSIQGTGIVWKPVSEGNRMLVVLTPSNYSSSVVTVSDGSGNVIERANNVGRTNGGRYTYRFARPGRDFPSPSYLAVGSSVFEVPSPASRYN